MNRNEITSILGVLDARIIDTSRQAAAIAAAGTLAERETALTGLQECVGACRVLRREVEDNLNKRVRGLEVFTRGGARLMLNGATILAVALRYGADSPTDHVVLVEWDRGGGRREYITANVYAHENFPRDITGWDNGHYFDDERAARADFIKRTGWAV